MSSYTLVILCLTPLNLLYADPGSGILLWQLATASALGLLFYAKAIVRKLRALVKSRNSKEELKPCDNYPGPHGRTPRREGQ